MAKDRSHNLPGSTDIRRETFLPEDTRLTIQIGIALHKPYPVCEDPLYLPIRVGAALGGPETPSAWQRDDEGDNISAQNPNYCELTAHWWLWKHSGADYVGLCHYRRYFGGSRFGAKEKRLLTLTRAEKLLGEAEALLPKKRHYWIETNASQYAHAHHAEDLSVCRAVIAAQGDARYTAAFDRVMGRRSGHRFNMLVMRRDLFSAYSAWLFAVLEETERRLDISAYSANDARVFGFLAERLLDVWLEVHQPKIREVPVVNLESQHWARKIAAFLKRKMKPRT